MSSTVGQVIRCKAVVAWEAGKPLVIEEIEVAPPHKMEVRLKIIFTSLCHTDVYFWEAKGQNPVFPRILGHEAGGIVESVGEGVTDLEAGDHVLPVFTGECKECAHYKSEESNMCNLLRINTDRGVMIHDEKSIIDVDVNSSRFEHAKKFGVTEFVNPKECKKPVQEVIAEMTDGGVDSSVECTGNIDAMISAFKCVHDGWGVTVLVGVPHKDVVFKTHPVNLLNERTLKGTFFENYKP
ncbi:hypothetical protein RJ639_000491 [Escallonia herrerae]|uniref:alcohol dehydrogenase n=1 Tax=Escallonia herrerae TaxID=1293975 RepID=A0AA88XBT8_9ASTE|nr:hypothetical protein RJ639_000491 [Escallonia herrerae]